MIIELKIRARSLRIGDRFKIFNSGYTCKVLRQTSTQTIYGLCRNDGGTRGYNQTLGRKSLQRVLLLIPQAEKPTRKAKPPRLSLPSYGKIRGNGGKVPARTSGYEKKGNTYRNRLNPSRIV